MDFIEAYNLMKQGKVVFKHSSPSELYSATLDNVTKKYTIFANGKALDETANWASVFMCNEWEVKNDI